MTVQQTASRAQRTGYRSLRHLGVVIRDLRELKRLCTGFEVQFERIETQLLTNAIDIAELTAGLPRWEDRLLLIREAGIEITREMYEGLAEACEDED